MIKIFQVISSLNVGGAENVALSLIDNCKSGNDQHPFQFIIIELFKSNSEYANQKRLSMDQQGIKIISLSKFDHRISMVFSPFHLWYTILKYRPNIVHSHTDLPDFVLAGSLRGLRLTGVEPPKIIRTIHNTQLWPSHFKLGKFTEKSFINDSIVAISNNTLDAYFNLRNRYNLDKTTKQIIIANGRPIPSKEDHSFDIIPNSINIAFCGRFEYQKGIDILISLIRELDTELTSHFTFHIVGDGSYRKEVKALSVEKKNVIYYEPVINLSKKFHAFDFIIMPSRFEGLVLTSIEASLSKIPVIAARAPGLAETLPNDWPLSFDTNSKEEISEILNSIVDKKYNMTDLALSAHNFVKNRFSLETMISSYSSLYESINES